MDFDERTKDSNIVPRIRKHIDITWPKGVKLFGAMNNTTDPLLCLILHHLAFRRYLITTQIPFSASLSTYHFHPPSHSIKIILCLHPPSHSMKLIFIRPRWTRVEEADGGEPLAFSIGPSSWSLGSRIIRLPAPSPKTHYSCLTVALWRQAAWKLKRTRFVSNLKGDSSYIIYYETESTPKSMNQVQKINRLSLHRRKSRLQRKSGRPSIFPMTRTICSRVTSGLGVRNSFIYYIKICILCDYKLKHYTYMCLYEP
jgi:hypothetical protein